MRRSAAATDPQLDGDRRRTWHNPRQGGPAGPDEQVASEFERLSEQARGRGGWASVAAFLERSAQLTPRRAAPCRAQALSAAHAKLVAGDPTGLWALFERAAPWPDNPLARARARRLDGSIQVALGDPARRIIDPAPGRSRARAARREACPGNAARGASAARPRMPAVKKAAEIAHAAAWDPRHPRRAGHRLRICCSTVSRSC